MGWANRLTVARGVLALILWGVLGLIGHGWVSRTEGAWWAAFIVFVVAALTDGLDGWIARRSGDVSPFGRVADPLVDKILILGSLLFLIGIQGVPRLLPPWTAAVILFRELLVTALRSAVEAKGGDFSAARSGKAKMLVQCVAVGSVMLHEAGVPFLRPAFPALSGPDAGAHDITWPHVLCVLAAVVTAVSGVDYAKRAWKALKAPPPRA